MQIVKIIPPNVSPWIPQCSAPSRLAWQGGSNVIVSHTHTNLIRNFPHWLITLMIFLFFWTVLIATLTTKQYFCNVYNLEPWKANLRSNYFISEATSSQFPTLVLSNGLSKREFLYYRISQSSNSLQLSDLPTPCPSTPTHLLPPYLSVRSVSLHCFWFYNTVGGGGAPNPQGSNTFRFLKIFIYIY